MITGLGDCSDRTALPAMARPAGPLPFDPSRARKEAGQVAAARHVRRTEPLFDAIALAVSFEPRRRKAYNGLHPQAGVAAARPQFDLSYEAKPWP